MSKMQSELDAVLKENKVASFEGLFLKNNGSNNCIPIFLIGAEGGKCGV